MLSVAVCDDELIECCSIAGKVKKIVEEMKLPCILRQFSSGRELLKSTENFDIIFLDILMKDLDGMQTAQLFRKKHFTKYLFSYLLAETMYLRLIMWKLFGIC